MSGPALLTFGCRLNIAESDIMRGLAAGAGDDLVVVNTCAVTAEAERQARSAIRRAHRERPGARIVVTGCAATIDPAAWAALPGVARVLPNADKLRPASWGAADVAAPLPAPASGWSGRVRAFVEVQNGCDHRCTFCVIPLGRGASRSVPAGAVVDRVRALLAAGAGEIVLTGVDLTSYGADLPGTPTLGALARRLLRLVPELARLRISSLDPAEIDDDLWDLIAGEERLQPHLHLSLQAGADLVLKRMRRRHSTADAAAAIARARALRPDIAIGADLIAGFPTETDALFEAGERFVAEHAIPYLHVFPFSERPGTPAARMPPVAPPVRRARAARLRALGERNAAAFHARFVGRVLPVLVEKPGAGRSPHFSPVRLDPAHPAGAIVALPITGADAAGLVAGG